MTGSVLRNTVWTRLYHWGGALLLVAAFATGFAVWPFRLERYLVHHRWLGWAVGVWGLVALIRPRALARFARDLTRFGRTDLVWLWTLPAAMLGRRPFGSHSGVLDPGQRIAAWLIIGLAAVGVVSGTAMLYTCDPECGQAFMVAFWSHRYSQIALAVVLVGHVIVSAGLLPGYRGVWRAMHGNGRVPVDVARRLWPGWLETKKDR